MWSQVVSKVTEKADLVSQVQITLLEQATN